MASAAGKAAAHQLPRRGIASGVKTGDSGGAGFVDKMHTARPPYGAFEPQRDCKSLPEWINAGAVEGHEKVRLRCAHDRLRFLIRFVDLAIDGLRQQRARNRRAAVVRAGARNRRPVFVGEAPQL